MNKAFTLAEILIVLTIVGVMAVMTIPSLMQNANSQHKIAMFKKAFNAVSNAYATEFATKTQPVDGSDEDYELMYNALINQLNVKYFYNPVTKTKTFNKPDSINDFSDVFMVTEDGIGYKVARYDKKCTPKLTILSKTQTMEALYSTCMHITVEINVGSEEIACSNSMNLNNLKCNFIRFIIASDGITAGNPDCIIAGRIMSDNTEYDCNKCGTCEG